MRICANKKSAGQSSMSQDYDHNLFHMVGSQGTHFSNPVSVSFSPLKAYDKGAQDFIPKSILPTFNDDGKFYSSAFIVPFDGLDSDKDMFTHFESLRQMQSDEKPIAMLVPKPIRSYFCRVCRVDFEDYLRHIKGQRHIQTVLESKFHKHILQLTNKFRRTPIPPLKEKESTPSRQTTAHQTN